MIISWQGKASIRQAKGLGMWAVTDLHELKTVTLCDSEGAARAWCADHGYDVVLCKA